jgi:hypothetical protein
MLRDTLWTTQGLSLFTWFVISIFFDDCGFADFGSWSCAAFSSSRISIGVASFTEFVIWTYAQISDIPAVIPWTNYVMAHGLPYFFYLVPTAFWIVGEV